MYEVFEHTADLGLRVTAPTLSALFSEAGRGLFSLIVENLDDVHPALERQFVIAGTDPVYLYFDWLNELLYAADVENLICSHFECVVTDEGLRATVRGETLDPARHVLLHEVKAITYHQLTVLPVAEGWEARVIVDI